jgi:AMMECR1 domain-containing protein
MAHLKYKAGLPPDFWHQEVTLARYTVTKWRETDRQSVMSNGPRLSVRGTLF